MFFELVRHSPQPALYDLGVQDNGTGVLLTITHQAWERVVSIFSTARQRLWFEKDFGVPFIYPGILPWGFGPAVTFIESASPSEVTILCELPRWDESNSNTWWKRALGACATLDFILDLLDYVRKEVEPLGRDQLIGVRLRVGREDGRVICGLSAGVAPFVSQWMRKQGIHDEFMPVTRHMRATWEEVYGRQIDRYELLSTHARIGKNGRLTLTCPGDRCCLYVEGHWNPDRDTGYDMYDHNVDTPAQLFTLLLGLASVNQQIRAEISRGGDRA